MMKQYDENGNGQLEKNEWSKNPDLARMDTNGDGIITRDELLEGLRNWRPGQGNTDSADQSGRGPRLGGGQGSGDQGGGGQGGGWGGRFGRRGQDGGTAPGGGSLAKSSSTGTTQVARYLDPAQRLPEGLPAWFIRADTNGDGQVEMHEFTSQWTEAEIARFNKYDLNGDGVITPDEVLQVEKAAAKAPPAAAKGPPPGESAPPAGKSST
jgi:Ca2+-binding EF-hand superfamily protein